MAKGSATWKRVKFGDVVRLNKETCKDPASERVDRFIGLEHLEPGDLRVRSWGDVAAGTTFTNRVRPGQVLFGKRRAYQRKVAVADFDAICSGDIYVFESASPSKLLPELLPFICQTDAFFNYAVGTSAGSLSPRTNWTSLAEYEFALPPLEEQRRIAELLATIETAKKAAVQAADAFAALRLRSYLDATQRGLARLSPSNAASSPLGDVPRHWRVVELGRAARILNSLRRPINAAERSQMAGPYPYYGPTGILDHINEYRVEGQYVLIGEDGDHFLKWAVWSMTQMTSGCCNVNNHAHILEGTAVCRTEWIFHFFRHRSVKEWVTKQGAGRLKLKKASLEKMWIALPPLDEQDELIRFFQTMDSRLQALHARHASLVALSRNGLKRTGDAA